MWIGNILGELVPIMGILMIIAIVIGPMWIRNYYAERDRAKMHETLRIAYEKGQPVPPELIEALQAGTDRLPQPSSTGPERDLRRAVVLIAVGLGLAGLGYGLWYGLSSTSYVGAYITGGAVAGAGAIPGMIGIAYLVLWLARRPAPKA